MKLKLLFLFAVVSALSSAVAPVFAAAAPSPQPLRILLVAGGCCHNYQLQADGLKKGLEARAFVQVDVVYSAGTTTRTTFPEYAKPDWAKGYDLILHDECSADVTDIEYIQRILAPHAQGLPAVLLHCAMHSFRTEGYNVAGTVTPWFEFTGLQTTGHGAQSPIAMTYLDKNNPITKGLADWVTGPEELYNNPMGGILPTGHPVAMGRIGNETSVVAWTNIYKGKARVFATTLGHNNPTVLDPNYLALVTRGLLWAADKLNDTYLKPALVATPVLTPQNLGLLAAPETATKAKDEAVASEPQECGCKDDDEEQARTD